VGTVLDTASTVEANGTVSGAAVLGCLRSITSVRLLWGPESPDTMCDTEGRGFSGVSAVLIVAVDPVVVGSSTAAVNAGDPATPIGELSRKPPEGPSSAGAPRRARLTGVPEVTPELRFAAWPDALSGRRCRPGSVDDEVDAVEADDVAPDCRDPLEDGDS
jgi:hypothetical protein